MLSLKEERINRGLSLRGLADATGVSSATLQRAEAGHAVSPGNAKAIADFFGVKVTDIWPVEQVAA